MFVVEDVFQAKYGKDAELAQFLQANKDHWPGEDHFQIMADLSSPYFTVVIKAVYDNLSAYEKSQHVFNTPRYTEWLDRMLPLVINGGREYYTLAD